MKKDKMPTTIALLVCSWFIAIFGVIISASIIILRFNDIKSLIIAFIIFFGCLFIATMTRMLANIGQMVFDQKSFLEQIIRDINHNIQQIRTFFEQIESHLDLRK